MTFRTAVIGVGHLGRQHARLHAALAAAGRTEFVAACDLNEETARAVAAARETEWTTDWRSLLGRVEAVSLATPTETHCELAVPLLEAGVHVLVEKPIARTLAEADWMIAAAERGGALLQVGHLERFNPALVALRPHVRHPLYFEIHSIGQFTARSLDIDVVLDLMIHDLDIILAVVRAEVTSIEAVGVPVLTPRFDIANVRLRFASGCIANITASRISRDRVRKIRFFQPDSYVSGDYAAQEVEGWRLVRREPRPAIEGGPVPVQRDEPLRRELADFVTAVRDGTKALVDGEAGRRALVLASAIAEKMETVV